VLNNIYENSFVNITEVELISAMGLSHRVDRVLRVLSSRWNWVSPTPSPACECVLPSYGWGGGGSHPLGGEGVGGPNSDEGTDTVLL
jgi:hypothetical protein